MASEAQELFHARFPKALRPQWDATKKACAILAKREGASAHWKELSKQFNKDLGPHLDGFDKAVPDLVSCAEEKRGAALAIEAYLDAVGAIEGIPEQVRALLLKQLGEIGKSLDKREAFLPSILEQMKDQEKAGRIRSQAVMIEPIVVWNFPDFRKRIVELHGKPARDAFDKLGIASFPLKVVTTDKAVLRILDKLGGGDNANLAQRIKDKADYEALAKSLLKVLLAIEKDFTAKQGDPERYRELFGKALQEEVYKALERGMKTLEGAKNTRAMVRKAKIISNLKIVGSVVGTVSGVASIVASALTGPQTLAIGIWATLSSIKTLGLEVAKRAESVEVALKRYETTVDALVKQYAEELKKTQDKIKANLILFKRDPQALQKAMKSAKLNRWEFGKGVANDLLLFPDLVFTKAKTISEAQSNASFVSVKLGELERQADDLSVKLSQLLGQLQELEKAIQPLERLIHEEKLPPQVLAAVRGTHKLIDARKQVDQMIKSIIDLNERQARVQKTMDERSKTLDALVKAKSRWVDIAGLSVRLGLSLASLVGGNLAAPVDFTAAGWATQSILDSIQTSANAVNTLYNDLSSL